MIARLNLQRPEHVLLIAGTNGKGSSVAMCDALLRAAGQKVGAYTSPHLLRYNERIVINGVAATDDAIITAFERVEAFRGGLPLTYFEYGTLAAMCSFADADLNVWILEVGLGGRLDASNAIEPSAALITNISLDHCEFLGDDIESIAAEKAAVMRAGVPCVFGDDQAPATILQFASRCGAHLLLKRRDFDVTIGADGSWSWHSGSRSLHALQAPGLPGKFQIHNAAAVLAMLAAAGFDRVLQRDLINSALPHLRLPGRLQRMRLDARDWLFDVAHNPAAANELALLLGENTSAGTTIAIIGLLQDKDVEGVLQPLLGVVDRCIAVTAESHRAIPSAELAQRIANQSGGACLVSSGIEVAVEFARRTSAENDRIVVTGSFFTVAPAIRTLERHQPELS
jgi:dihydrofolate synthase/folylpolyglutamate synthase